MEDDPILSSLFGASSSTAEVAEEARIAPVARVEPLTVPEGLSPTAALALLLEAGVPLQQLHAIERLPAAVAEHGWPACDALLRQLFRQQLPALSVELQAAAAQCALALLGVAGLPPPAAEDVLLPALLGVAAAMPCEPGNVLSCECLRALLALVVGGGLSARALEARCCRSHSQRARYRGRRASACSAAGCSARSRARRTPAPPSSRAASSAARSPSARIRSTWSVR